MVSIRDGSTLTFFFVNPHSLVFLQSVLHINQQKAEKTLATSFPQELFNFILDRSNMFAVPGWSLSADSLKAETTTKATSATTPGESGPSTKGTGANATNLFAATPAKKRKREKTENTNSTGPQVTKANVADLWERVIEGREPPKRDDKKAKRQKKDKKDKKDNRDSKDSDGKSETQKTQSKPAAEAVATPSKAAPKEKTAKKVDVKVQAVETTPKPAAKTAAPKPTPKPKPTPQTAEKTVQQESTKKEKKKQNRDGVVVEATKPTALAKTEKQPTPQQKKFEKVDKVGKAELQFDQKNKKPAAEKPAALSPAAASPAPAKPTSALARLLPPAAPKLTPLQASMRAKLVSARFRHLNETLYTSPSEEALRLFGESPDMFQAYHEGFRQQVSVWPENPVDGYVAEVHRRAGKGDKAGKGGRGGRGGRGGGRGGRGGLYHIQRDPTDTLPRTRGHCRLADIGCGDARLATSLAPDAKKIRIEVLSFDLHADPSNPHITAAADASELPITTGTVDVAVFCLALMGTNWLTFIEEAYRILRWKGELWVAEIKSRFAGSGELRARMKQKLKQQPVSHSVGFRRKNGIKGGKKGAQDEEDPDVLAAAMAEVDGDDDGAGATDVTAFVHALRRRGFVLDEIAGGEDGNDDKAGGKAPAVDLSNKMFVRLRFIKAAPALVGKEEVMEALAAMNGNKDSSKRPKLKYHDDDEKKNADPMDDPALEAKILKPCVYKLR